jgi:hypothetical protein
MLRDRLARAVVLFGAALLVSTEALGAFGWIGRVPLSVWWIAVCAAGLVCLWRRGFTMPRIGRDPVVILCLAGTAAVFALTALAAGFSPPNSADAMAYHMPRIVYWAEQGSVRFFPTPYLNQIMLQPFAEYAMLHTYVLTGGDRLIDFVQWSASVVSVAAVSRAAGLMGAGARGQAIAAVFAATLPSGILASSGAKNDYVLAMWIAIAICFALRFAQAPALSDAAFLGAALGFALLTKGTAYLFAPFPLLAILYRAHAKKFLLASLLIAAAINTPHYLRNYGLSGSVLGFDSAQGDGFFRWRNETFGWRQTVSNAVRNLSDQLGGRSEAWNRGVYRAALGIHRALGIDPNDPATTWRWSSYGPPVNANHEANAPNRWHLAILLIACCVGINRRRALYALALVVAFIAFCGYLKWQPFFSRLLLPLFIMGAPLVAIFGRRWVLLQIALVVFLLNNARPALLENWVRPLKGPHSVFRVARDDRYFSDMTQWNNRTSYLETVDTLAASPCNIVGIDATEFQLEYPLMALLRERKPNVEFVHVNVRNASSKYAPPVAGQPCVTVRLSPGPP